MGPIEEYKKILNDLIDISYQNKTGHIGPSLSCLLPIFYIYKNFDMDNNKFVLSKGHAALGLYCILKHFGYIDKETLFSYCKKGSELYGHCSLNQKLGIHATTGSLGNGFSIAVGMALASPNKKVFVVVGDGECEEGIIWESARFASQQQLSNLYVLIDNNEWKGYDKAESYYKIMNKFESFGFQCTKSFSPFNTKTIEDKYWALEKSFDNFKIHTNKVFPKCISMQTHKSLNGGHEDKNKWHYQKLDQDLYNQLKKQIAEL